MRQAINENRTVQLVLVGILALAGVVFLLKGKGGSESTPPPPAATSSGGTAAAPTDSGTAAPATTDSTAAPATDTSTGSLPVSTASAAAVPASLVPGPGLPHGLMAAYHNDKGIVLLIRRAGGIDDAFVHIFVNEVHSSHWGNRVKVYVTKAKDIARYAWLTQGVDVTELPALVVLLPRKLSDGGPTATVSYGFRYPAGVLQTVKDALFNGPTREYHP